MKTRNLILPGIALVVLAMLATTVFAGEESVIVGPDPDMRVYLVKKAFDICDQWTDIPGGQVPHSDPIGSDVHQYGCVDFVGERLGQYLFTGEQMAVLVAARNVNGKEAILDAVLTGGAVDVECQQIDPGVCTGTPGEYWNKCSWYQAPYIIGAPEAQYICQQVGCTWDAVNKQCTPADQAVTCGGIKDPATCEYVDGCNWNLMWFGHDISGDLAVMPPAISGGTHNGFDPAFDKLYQCIYTATEDDSGETEMLVEVTYKGGTTESECSVPDYIWFNPEINIEVGVSGTGTDIVFDAGSSGATVYSTNTLRISNIPATDGSGVDVALWLAGNDLVSDNSIPAQCPYSGILDVDKYMEFRCKIGTMFNNPWHFVPNPNEKFPCVKVGDYCQGAMPLTPDVFSESLLSTGKTAECWFRLTYPIPCIGNFISPASGGILIYARAI